ncbi:DGQHR domain-containing protein [Spirosoma sp. KUDC1026]|uniref:DGQHR domain-containing protein n=1 Tax=Spirosoma sp. KUDC1026 TaxID=2745947 RepID=UPI00159BBB86|nr:DGQHR domain-containing protein [Spirosoma sp. KUDC1026]QKZ13444.1 DGQHR domain-containing protein [Spirosoma sp. KUDC1026]
MTFNKKIPVLKVNQWLDLWNTVPVNEEGGRKPPQHNFYVFSIKAPLLKKLSKVYPRKADAMREVEIGIQRRHDPERSSEISNYLKRGYPLSEMGNKNTIPNEMKDLQMPGWLPTVIVANILTKNTKRGREIIRDEDVINLHSNEESNWIELPDDIQNVDWDPIVPPIEIIDGQHRLWAFDNEDKSIDDFELPVVAFFDLDITWQAYLFYTINVKPKRINKSLAYDLYPILRIQEWLERSPDTANIYKETRAQEVIEILWSYKKSPWYNRINMLGESQNNFTITQASFIRNLVASFIKTSVSKLDFSL